MLPLQQLEFGSKSNKSATKEGSRFKFVEQLSMVKENMCENSAKSSRNGLKKLMRFRRNSHYINQ
jgi:hypothetical protein